MNRRAYSFLELKAVDREERVLEGLATTPTADRVGDIVESKGAQFKLPLPLLLDHNHAEAVGHVESAEVTGKGIRFRARIAKIAEPGEAKDLCDKAWSLVKHRLRAAVSIGFRPLDMEPMPSGGLRFKAWEWFELSLVAVPANAEAGIETVKRLDREARLRNNPGRVVRLGPVRRAMLDEAERGHGNALETIANTIAVGAKATDTELASLDQRVRALEGTGGLTPAERQHMAEVARLMDAGDTPAAMALVEAQASKGAIT